MSPFDLPFFANLLKDPAIAKAYFKDPKVVAEEFSKHLDALAKSYEQLKVTVTEPRMQSQLRDLADKVAEAKEKLPSLLEEFFNKRQVREQRLPEEVAQACQQVAEHRQRMEAMVATTQDGLQPALGRNGEVFDRYLGKAGELGAPPDPGSIAEWALEYQLEHKPAFGGDSASDPASPTAQPAEDVEREPTIDYSSFSDWVGTEPVARDTSAPLLIGPQEHGPAPVPPTGHEPSAPQLENTSWSILEGISPRTPDSVKPLPVDPPRGMNSWIASGGESMAPPEGTAPAAESPDEARRRFLEWKERLTKSQSDKET